jgi:hypothetical protein
MIIRLLLMVVPSGLGWQVFVSLMLYILIFLFTQVFLYTLKDLESKWHIIAAGHILAHLSGFATLYAFAGLQSLSPLKDNILYAALLVPVALVWLFGLEMLASKARIAIALAGDDFMDENEVRWHEQVEEVNNESMSISIGFLLMQVARFAITGQLQPYHLHDTPKCITQFYANILLGCVILFALLTVFGTALLLKLFPRNADDDEDEYEDEEPQGVGHRLSERCITAFAQCTAMAFAFCFLFWGEWQLYAQGYHGVRIKGVLMVALLVTACSLVLIFVLDFVEDLFAIRRAARSLIMGAGVLIGISWEKGFDLGVEALAHPEHEEGAGFLFEPGSPMGMMLSLLPWIAPFLVPSFMLCVALPAWKLYVLPQVDPDVIRKAEAQEDREDEAPVGADRVNALGIRKSRMTRAAATLGVQASGLESLAESIATLSGSRRPGSGSGSVSGDDTSSTTSTPQRGGRRKPAGRLSVLEEEQSGRSSTV